LSLVGTGNLPVQTRPGHPQSGLGGQESERRDGHDPDRHSPAAPPPRV